MNSRLGEEAKKDYYKVKNLLLQNENKKEENKIKPFN